MSSSKVKVGVVGVGRMGEFHLQKYLSIPEAEVVGVYEPDPLRAKEIGRYGVKCFKNLSELLFEADAISVTSPTAIHCLVASQALKAGVHVLVEKPISDKIESAEELILLASRLKLILQVGFIERFRFRALTKNIKTEAIRFVETHRLSPSLSREGNIDVVSDLMIHDLDLVLSLLRKTPSQIAAIGVPVLTEHFDLANVRLEFDNGAVANLNVSRVSSDPVRKFRIFSSNNYLSLDFISNSAKICTRSEDGKIKQEVKDGIFIDALMDQCVHFIDCVSHQTRPIVSGEDGLRALVLAEAIKNRIKKGASRVSVRSHKPLELSYEQ